MATKTVTSNLRFNVSTIFILGLALLMRLVLLNQSFWLDEAAQALESIRPLTAQFSLKTDFQPPLYHLIVHFLSLASHAEWWLRLASLIPGLITVYLVIKLARLLFDDFTASFAGLLLATSQFHIFYSQELRPYALATCLATWSMYAFFKLVKKPQSSLISLTLANSFGLYTTYLYPLVLVVQAFLLIIYKRRLARRLFPSLGLAVLAFLPWLPTFVSQLSVGTSWLSSTPGWATVVSPPLIKTIPLTLVKLAYGRINLTLNLNSVLFLLTLTLVIVLAMAGKKFHPIREQLVWWFVLPMLIAFLISLKIPVLDPKRVLFVLPALYLLIASGLDRSFRAFILIFFLLSFQLYAFTQYVTLAVNQREPWRQAISAIESKLTNRTVVAFAFPEPFAPWQWYASSSIPTTSLVPKHLSDSELQSKLDSITGYQTIVTFDYLTDLTDPTHRLDTWLTTHGYQQGTLLDYPNIGFIRYFDKPQVFASSFH